MAAVQQVGTPHDFTLSISMVTNVGTVSIAPDATPTAKVTLESTGAEIAVPAVAYAGALGQYKTTWTPVQATTYVLTWTFIVDGDTYTNEETIVAMEVVSDAGVVAELEPDIGFENTCKLTATFIDAGGNYLSGVYVKFTPSTTGTSATASGFVANDVVALSGTDGVVGLYAVRGAIGLLSMSHTGVVRRVTIPDTETKDLFELAAEGDDLLEVQSVKLLEIPRRS
jgi:hypothetical protein